MVFAKAVTDQVGYAIPVARVTEILAAAGDSTESVPTGQCVVS